MNLVKRAVITLKRNLGKNVAIFLIFLLLGVMVSSSVSITNAINLTNYNLIGQIPPVVTMNLDTVGVQAHHELHGDRPDLGFGNRSFIENIGALTYVRAFDYSLVAQLSGSHGFFSNSLSIPTDTSYYLDLAWYTTDESAFISMLEENLNLFSLQTVHTEQFVVKGVRHPSILDIEEGMLELIAGRTFTVVEVENGGNVTLVSDAFARENNLHLGDFITLEYRIYEHPVFVHGGVIEPNEVFYSDNISATYEVAFEIIGLFSPRLEINEDTTQLNVRNHMSFNATIYVPIDVVREGRQFYRDNVKVGETMMSSDFIYQDVIFALYSSHDLETFNLAANNMLPEFWQLNDLREEFSHMTNVMENFEGMSNAILISALGSSFLIFNLIMLLIVRERRHEIGVYLALGDNRKRIFMQIFFELKVIAVFAVSCALIIGHLISQKILLMILEQDILNNAEVIPRTQFGIFANDLYVMGFGVEMTAQQMYAAFEGTLNIETVLSYFLIVIVTILISLIIPMFYLMRLSPKEFLSLKET